MPQGYGYPMQGMMMPTQGWGVPAQRVVKSTTATRKTAQNVRKRSDGKTQRVLMIRSLNYVIYRYKKMRALQYIIHKLLPFVNSFHLMPFIYSSIQYYT